MLDIESAGTQMFRFKKALHYDCYDRWLDESFKYALVEHMLDIESASRYRVVFLTGPSLLMHG